MQPSLLSGQQREKKIMNHEVDTDDVDPDDPESTIAATLTQTSTGHYENAGKPVNPTSILLAEHSDESVREMTPEESRKGLTPLYP